MKVKRFCLDCNCLISDKRFSFSSQGKRCKICQKAFRTEYLRVYWQGVKDKFLARRKLQSGGLMDRFTRKKIDGYLQRHKMTIRHTVRITKHPFARDSFFDWEHDQSDNQIKKLIDKYGVKNIKVL